MKALVCRDYGAPESLEVSALPSPTSEPGQVLIDVDFAGVSFVDTLTIRDLHQNPHPLPFAPGMEIAGTVADANGGPFEVGQAVAALTYDGGFAEQAVANASEVFPLPDGLNPSTAASCLSVYLTAYLALLDGARIQPGELVAVTGAAGGVGLGAVEIAAATGAEVIACASSPEKLEIAGQRGAKHLINYSTDDLKSELKKIAPQGTDVVLDVLGGELGETAFRSLGWGGRFLTVGFAAGGVPKFPANLLLVKNRAALGFVLMHYRKHRHDVLQEAAQELFAMIGDERIRPLVREVGSLEDGPRFLRDIMDRRAVGKTVLKIR